jgi:hypothetical protein
MPAAIAGREIETAKTTGNASWLRMTISEIAEAGGGGLISNPELERGGVEILAKIVGTALGVKAVESRECMKIHPRVLPLGMISRSALTRASFRHPAFAPLTACIDPRQPEACDDASILARGGIALRSALARWIGPTPGVA